MNPFGFTFVTRGYPYDVRHLKDLITRAIRHKGLAFLDVLQPCLTYNDILTKEYWAGEGNVGPDGRPKPRTYKLEETGYDPVVHMGDEGEMEQKIHQAIQKSFESGDHPRLACSTRTSLCPHMEEDWEAECRATRRTRRPCKRLRAPMVFLDEIGLIELNEAFAAQVLGCMKELGLSTDRTNIYGSGISLGHPIGCTGTRLVVTLLHGMKRRNIKHGLACMCIGGGQGMAAVFELAA